MILNPYAIVIDVYATLGGKQPGATSYADHKAYINANGQAAYLTALEGMFATQTNATMSATILANLGLASIFTAAQGEAYLAANAGNRVKAALDLASALTNYVSDATNTNDTAILAAKTTYVATTANAYTYASNSANTSDAATSAAAVSTGQTFTLTTGADTLTGDASDNTLDASGFFNAPTGTTLQTLSNSDRIDGGDGTDTLNVALNTATATTRAASLANVEVINLTNTVGTNILDLANATGVTTLNSVNSATQIAQFNNVQSMPTAFGMTNTGVGLTANILNTALAGTTDTATLTLDGVTAGTVTLQSITAASGYETLNIVSAGSTANVLTAVTDGNGTSLATINVSGTPAINLGTTLDATVLTVNASDLVGALTVVQTNAVKTTITGGAGADSIDVSGAFVDLTDTTNADVINGGDGTDTLILSYAELVAIGSAAQFANVTNIETISVDTATATSGINGTFLTGVTTIALGGLLGNGLTHTFTSGQEIQYDLADNGTDTEGYTITGSGTTDVLNIDINGVDIGAGQRTYTGIETVNIATSGTSLIDGAHVMTATAATEAINISGTGVLTLGNITADTVTSTMTSGTLNLGTMQQATNFTGGASIDTITGSTAADILSGGAGADFLTNTATGANTEVSAGDVMTGGDGFDTFTLVGASASAANYSGSSTITDFTVGTSATNTDLIRFTAGDTSYDDDGGIASGIGDAAGVDAAATGDAVVIQTVAQNASAAAVTGATVNMFKLTTGVAFTTDLQGTFNAAIGTGTVTGLTADSQLLFTMYDTTNSVMVIGSADVNGTGTSTVFETGDVVNLIGTVSMTAADYALMDTDNYAVFVA